MFEVAVGGSGVNGILGIVGSAGKGDDGECDNDRYSNAVGFSS